MYRASGGMIEVNIDVYCSEIHRRDLEDVGWLFQHNAGSSAAKLMLTFFGRCNDVAYNSSTSFPPSNPALSSPLNIFHIFPLSLGNNPNPKLRYGRPKVAVDNYQDGMAKHFLFSAN
jgi:hypothetical protein